MTEQRNYTYAGSNLQCRKCGTESSWEEMFCRTCEDSGEWYPVECLSCRHVNSGDEIKWPPACAKCGHSLDLYRYQDIDPEPLEFYLEPEDWERLEAERGPAPSGFCIKCGYFNELNLLRLKNWQGLTCRYCGGLLEPLG